MPFYLAVMFLSLMMKKDTDLPKDSKDRFLNRPVWQRMIVISAGVIANVITAFFLVLITSLVWENFHLLIFKFI